MINNKHNTLKRLAELYSKSKAILDNYDYKRPIYEEVELLFRECLDELLCVFDLDFDSKLIRTRSNKSSLNKLYDIIEALELAIYRLVWGKATFDGLVDSLIKSDYDEAE